MDEPLVFTSYTNPYDDHVGEVSVNDLSSNEQDEIIRLVLAPEGDLRAFVMKRDIIKAEVEGLWSVVIYVALLLERRGLIDDFDERSLTDIDKIIGVLQTTPLGVRLEAAFLGGHDDRSHLDWASLQMFGRDSFFDDCATLEDGLTLIRKHLRHEEVSAHGCNHNAR